MSITPWLYERLIFLMVSLNYVWFLTGSPKNIIRLILIIDFYITKHF